MIDLTVIILTKNEEDNINKCIHSFKGIAKRFVIVDSYSTDKTKEICLNIKNVDFYENKFIDHATQFNWALKNTNITTEWTMRMDADEEFTNELIDELMQKLEALDKSVTGIILKRRTYFMGRWIKHGAVYPTKLLRIFRSGKAYCEQKSMDEHIILKDGQYIEFDNDIIDNNTKDLEWWTHKHNWYSNKEVIDYYKLREAVVADELKAANLFLDQASRKRWFKNKIYLKIPLFLRPKIYYIYRYYIKLGFLDGTEGKIYHFLQAYWYRFLVDAKIYECTKYSKKMGAQGDLK